MTTVFRWVVGSEGVHQTYLLIDRYLFVFSIGALGSKGNMAAYDFATAEIARETAAIFTQSDELSGFVVGDAIHAADTNVDPNELYNLTNRDHKAAVHAFNQINEAVLTYGKAYR